MAVVLATLLPSWTAAGKKDCPVGQVYIQEVAVKERAGIDHDGIRGEFVPALEKALLKNGFSLADAPAAAGAGGVSLKVRVRAWNSKTGSGRLVLELAASVRIMQAEAELWDGDVNTGGISRLLNSKNSTPANLAKRTAELVADACQSGWTLDQ